MFMDKDKIYIEEIKDFCRKIIAFTEGLSYEDFVGDEKLQLAVVKLIENVGEASKRLSESTRANYPGVDWNKALAMRNKLVHEYMEVDLSIVFDVAMKEIPALLKSLDR